MVSSWQTDRGQLNHNWLQNGVLVALNHAVRLASGCVRSSAVRQALAEDVLRWEQRRNEVPGFLARFEDEMSPKGFFERIPLCRCSPGAKSWLIPLTHELWLRREKAREKIGTARSAYGTAERTYEAAQAALRDLREFPTIEELQPLELLLRDLRKACEDLSRAISALPHETRVL